MLAGIGACGAYQALVLPTNFDVAWYLYAAGRVLDGARLYVDIVEVNPPLILALSMTVEAVARLLGIPALVLFPLVVLGLIAVSLALCARLTATLLPAGLGRVAILAQAYFLLVHVRPMFGQREHLLLILILPYLHAAAERARGGTLSRPLGIGTGLLAGVGFGLKPFFLPTFAAVELYLLSRRGGRIAMRDQALAVVGVLLLYAGAVVVLTPEYFPLARACARIYRAYQPYGALLGPSSWRLVIVAVAIAWARVRVRGLAAEWTDILSVTVLGLTCAVYLQGKGWLYHWYPAVAVSGILILVSLAAAWGASAAGVRRGGREIGLVAVVLVSCLWTLARWSAVTERTAELGAQVRFHAAGASIFAFSSYAGAGFPLVNETRVSWASRHLTLWQIPGFYQDGGWAQADTTPGRR